jgi:hypothetical protein
MFLVEFLPPATAPALTPLAPDGDHALRREGRAGTDRTAPPYEPGVLEKIQRDLAATGLPLIGLEGDPFDMGRIKLDLPGRDEDIARQLAPHGITVNNLAPGVILTDRNTGCLADDACAQRVRAGIPAGFFGGTSDCAGTALLLCSDAGRYITGQTLFVDGGMSLF